MRKRRESKVMTGEYVKDAPQAEAGDSAVAEDGKSPGAEIASAVFAGMSFEASPSGVSQASSKSESDKPSSLTSSSKADAPSDSPSYLSGKSPASRVETEAAGESFVSESSFEFNVREGDAPLDAVLSEDDLVRLESMESFLSEEGDYAALPRPELFNAYPPEVQRKIMEWTDRDVKARRDDESRRQDELMRAEMERERRRQVVPAIIIVLSLLCGAITGVLTQNPLFSIVFLIVPLAVIAERLASADRAKRASRDERNKPPRV